MLVQHGPTPLSDRERAAEAFGSKGVFIQNGEHLPSFTQAAPNTSKAHRRTPTIHVSDILYATPVGSVPIAMEIGDDAVSLVDFPHPKNAFYIFGPEDGSLPTSWNIPKVQIPTEICLNLAATVNVVLYDRIAKQLRRYD